MKVLAAIVGLLELGCATLPKALPPVRETPPAPATRTFHVLSHGWHTGIALPAADLNRRLPDLARRFPRCAYYEIGWGDAGFYQSPKVTTGLALQAMFRSPGTVVHVVGFNAPPPAQFLTSEVLSVSASEANYRNLLHYLVSSFALDADGRPVSRGPGLYGDSAFYAATGRYHACNTCNKWTAKALTSAGVELSPAISLTSDSVMDKLRAMPAAGR
ncbi:MAG: TIGR02117 family protein [Verrucomicrobia bacterium]|nr:TIGR02117 family protein [Verrucomicrobiota bacterium]